MAAGDEGADEAGEPIPIERLPVAPRSGAGFACAICADPLRFVSEGKPLICGTCQDAMIVAKLAAD